MYLIEPTEITNALRGKRVQVYESEDGSVSIRFQGQELNARAFRKDGFVDQGAIVENKLLGHLLEQIRDKQLERDQKKLRSRSITLRDKKLIAESIEQKQRAETT